jgi:FdhD protein
MQTEAEILNRHPVDVRAIPRPGPTTRVRVTEGTADGRRERADVLATEEPMEVRLAAPGLAAAPVVVTMRTPGHDFELAAGYSAA